MSVSQTDAAPQVTREERVAALVEVLERARHWEAHREYRESNVEVFRDRIPLEQEVSAHWLLTTVEALAGVEHRLTAFGFAYCIECGHAQPDHTEMCIAGISAEAWRRFTAKGEHGGT